MGKIPEVGIGDSAHSMKVLECRVHQPPQLPIGNPRHSLRGKAIHREVEVLVCSPRVMEEAINIKWKHHGKTTPQGAGPHGHHACICPQGIRSTRNHSLDTQVEQKEGWKDLIMVGNNVRQILPGTLDSGHAVQMQRIQRPGPPR